VGSKRGSQLYEADFSPRLPSMGSPPESTFRKRLDLTLNYGELNNSTNFVSDVLCALHMSHNGSFNDDTASLSSSSTSVHQLFTHAFKIQTLLCSRNGISLEINRTHQFGKKFRKGHSEYEIEIKMSGRGIDSDEQWSIFRRYYLHFYSNKTLI
jgi:hypothetical protein